MDSATLPAPMQAPSASNLQTNNPQTWSQTDLQPQPSSQSLGNSSTDIPLLLSQSNNHTIQLRGTRTAIINDAVAPTAASARPSIVWLGVALALVVAGLVLVLSQAYRQKQSK